MVAHVTHDIDRRVEDELDRRLPGYLEQGYDVKLIKSDYSIRPDGSARVVVRYHVSPAPIVIESFDVTE